jgi:hypothetical protein
MFVVHDKYMQIPHAKWMAMNFLYISHKELKIVPSTLNQQLNHNHYSVDLT